MKIISYSTHRFHVLDGMRGIAAVLVMLFHYYSRDSLRVFGNTYIAVDFFFILSGFVISHSYEAKMKNGMRSAEYLARRVGRLYPLMALGVLLGLPTLIVEIRSGTYDLSYRELVVAVSSNLAMAPFLNGNTKLFAGNRSVTGQIFPSDDPLWSIFAEMLASLLFLFLIRLRTRKLAEFCILAAFIFGVAAFLNGLLNYQLCDVDMGWNTVSLFGLFPRVAFGFSCGVLLYQIRNTPAAIPYLNVFQRPLTNSSTLLYVCLVAVLMFPYRVFGLYSLVAVLGIAPALVAQGANAKSSSKISEQVSSSLGWISFPIYCLHRPILSIVQNESILISQISGLHISIELTAIIATLSMSVLFAWALDRSDVQRHLTRLILRLFSKIY